MKNIFIVRHGQSESNANVRGLLSKEKEYVNDCNFGLTDVGKKQAYDAGRRIISKAEEKQIYNIYVSPFKRTRQTAFAIEEVLLLGKMYIKRRVEDPRLVEQDFGDFDFQYRDKWEEISPHSYKVNKARYNDPLGRFFARLENGENLLDVYNRVSLFVTTRLERDIKTSKEENYIIVTHANTMRVMKMFLLDMEVESFNKMELPKNASGFHIKFNEESNSYLYVGEF